MQTIILSHDNRHELLFSSTRSPYYILYISFYIIFCSWNYLLQPPIFHSIHRMLGSKQRCVVNVHVEQYTVIRTETWSLLAKSRLFSELQRPNYPKCLYFQTQGIYKILPWARNYGNLLIFAQFSLGRIKTGAHLHTYACCGLYLHIFHYDLIVVAVRPILHN